MITFASLFLGLVFGVVDVEMTVGTGVARVAISLDGRQVAEVGPPWRAPVDLGRPPAPHELVAVAFDAQGSEVGRARQWINRPRAVAEAAFVLERGSGGRGRVARLGWRCLTSERPDSIVVTFDGKRIEAPDPSRIEIPTYVPERAHFLRAELQFEGGVTATADAMFGGSRNADTLRELTAVPVVLDRWTKLPAVERMDGWFVADRPLKVAAVEEGPKEVLFVCDGDELGRFTFRVGMAPYVEIPLGKETSFRYVNPVGATTTLSRTVSTIFPMTQPFTSADGGIRDVAYRAFGHTVAPARGQKVAEAVASAALVASGQERRRAVVLVAGKWQEDASRISPQEAESFLASLRVPLFVWALGWEPGPVALQWQGARKLISETAFLSALSDLETNLDRQRIVWVEGTHLPQAITLGPAAKGIRLAR